LQKATLRLTMNEPASAEKVRSSETNIESRSSEPEEGQGIELPVATTSSGKPESRPGAEQPHPEAPGGSMGHEAKDGSRARALHRLQQEGEVPPPPPPGMVGQPLDLLLDADQLQDLGLPFHAHANDLQPHELP